PRERTFRTVRTVGIFWGIGVVALFIPVAHFVLVPLFLLLGLLSPFFTPAKEGVVLGGTAKCPACDSELAIPRMPERWPLSDVCSSCKRALTIQKA
ncbi:MAG: hypothetical protein KDD64_17120, partial [Bdellovibrionales bacterium]|nr:hypothetical protein [Bdellovibrionales bacterium]